MIQVIIVNDETTNPCTANCGADWSSTETLDSARTRINEIVEGQVLLEYLDLTQASDSVETRLVRERTRGMPLPVLLVNGRPRIAGQFDLRQLLDVIEAELEVKLNE